MGSPVLSGDVYFSTRMIGSAGSKRMASEPHPLRHMKSKHGVIARERTERQPPRGELKHGAQVVDGGSISNAAALPQRKAQVDGVGEIDPRRERGHEEGYTRQRQRLIRGRSRK